MTKWTAPDIASIRGDNSRPLQKIFGSLTEYLKDTLSQTTEVSQTYVRNGETTALTIGTVVYLDAQQGDRATVKRAYNTSDATSAKTLGVVAEVIPANADGLVTTLGYLEKVNTSAFTAGQTLYLGATAGTFTATKPVAPNHMVYVGVVVRANAGNGIIYVRCQNGYELDEIHDVLITSPTAGQTLSYDAVTSLWKNATFSDGGGLTNLNASNLASGTVPSARMTGAYTGITGLGTLTSLTIDGPLSPSVFFGDWNQNNNWSGIRGTFGYLLTGSNGAGNTGIFLRSESATHSVYIGSNNTNTLTVTNTSATVAGTMNATTFSGSGASLTSLPAGQLTGTVASARLSGSYTGITQLGTISPSLTVTGGTGTTITAIANALITGSNNNGAIYLGGGTGSNATGGIEASWRNAANPSIAFGVTRDNNGTKIVCEYTGSVIRFFGGGSQEAYLNNGGFSANHYYGAVQYGSYGSLSVYGVSNSWAGIVFPDTTSTMMVQNTYFGHYRNNTTWNFYVNNGTYVPSDERYKRDIQPLENGLNFIREIIPVTYDPLTESLDDDPETTVGKTHYGFTTQNILQALSNAGETRDVAVVDIGGPSTEGTNSDRQYLNHSALIAPMVKAIQELDARLQQLETV